MTKTYEGVTRTAQEYYNSVDADQFYYEVWGGEDIHVGLYEQPGEPIRDASRRTVEKMAGMLGEVTPDTRIIDVGAGYGGAGRYLAKRFGCKVVCLNLSEVQNQRDREMNREQGLDHLVDVWDGSFDAIDAEDASFDKAWSEDAILHSDNRRKVLEEVYRVLKPGGDFVFTDPMQKDDVPEGVLQPVYDRIHLESLGSFELYRKTAKDIGFEEVEIVDLSEHLPRHYGRVREELQSRYDELTKLASKEYVDRMLQGLQNWVDAGNNGYLSWGILHFRKPA